MPSPPPQVAITAMEAVVGTRRHRTRRSRSRRKRPLQLGLAARLLQGPMNGASVNSMAMRLVLALELVHCWQARGARVPPLLGEVVTAASAPWVLTTTMDRSGRRLKPTLLLMAQDSATGVDLYSSRLLPRLIISCPCPSQQHQEEQVLQDLDRSSRAQTHMLPLEAGASLVPCILTLRVCTMRRLRG